jgi:hypothetical protein
MVIMLVIGPKVHGFKPHPRVMVFKGDKNPDHNFLPRGSRFSGVE